MLCFLGIKRTVFRIQVVGYIQFNKTKLAGNYHEFAIIRKFLLVDTTIRSLLFCIGNAVLI